MSPPWEVLLGAAAIGLGVALCLAWALRPLPKGMQDWRFVMHLHTLVAAISWRHLHQRALTLHLFRVAVPALMLVLMYKAREMIARQIHSAEVGTVLQMQGGTSEGALQAIVEYVLSLTLIYIVMMSMLFFVWHVSAESESGFRHLLHVSGLSRPAYILATAGVDGFFLSLISLLLMLFLAGGLLEVRMVLWSSPVLVLMLMALLSTTAVTTGYLLHFLCPTSRVASMAAQLILVVVTFTGPVQPLSTTVPEVGQQSWKTLALPTLPAYRAVFELVAGCVKGRCLTLGDAAGAFVEGRWASPMALLWGAKESPEFTPPEILVSFAVFAFIQVAASAALIVLLDAHRHPALHDSGAARGGGQGVGAGAGAGAGTGEAEGDADAILEVDSLVHQYGWLPGMTASGPKVLNGVSFSAPPGSLLGLLGPNGAGKTTIIRCITGEERANEGRVAINASAVTRKSGAYIGLCPQETVINRDLTVYENLLFFACVRGASRPEALAHADHMLLATCLTDKRDVLPNALSGGMQRRLAVGCAMIASPAVAILDEPTTGLDPITRRSVWSAIQEVKVAGGCVLLTSHMLEEVEALCTKIVIIQKGQKVAEGTTQQLKEKWGTGYMLSVDCNVKEEELAIKYMGTLLPEKDRAPVRMSDGQLTFKFTNDEEALGHLIIALARRPQDQGVKRWGVSQASLEDAYVRIIQQDAGPAQV